MSSPKCIDTEYTDTMELAKSVFGMGTPDGYSSKSDPGNCCLKQ